METHTNTIRHLTDRVLTIALICFCFISQSVFSQFLKPQNEFTGGMGFFRFGSANVKLSALNEELRRNDFPLVSEGFSSLGVGAYRVIDNWVYGAGGQGLIGILNENQRLRVQANGGYGLLYVGHIVYQKEKLNVYPVLGVGGGGMNFNVQSVVTPSSFDNFLNNPFREGNVTMSSLLLNFELNADYFLTGITQQGRLEGWLGGLSVGYLLSPFKSEWQMNGLLLANSPQTRLEGFYFTIKIGGGGFNLKSNIQPAPDDAKR